MVLPTALIKKKKYNAGGGVEVYGTQNFQQFLWQIGHVGNGSFVTLVFVKM